MERATGTEVYGCGSPQSTDITLNIQTTTGGNFSISLNGKNTVEHLKKLVSKKLKVSKDRICLLHRERQLRDGTLDENGLLDGSRVILLPSVETGLLSQRPENSVMQALESLNDTQVNDFLSGKSPLNLTMRLGDHMMLIQLQLSTLNSGSGSSRSLKTSTSSKSSSTSVKSKCEVPSPQVSPLNVHTHKDNKSPKSEGQASMIQKQDLEMLQNAFDTSNRSSSTPTKSKCESSCPQISPLKFQNYKDGETSISKAKSQTTVIQKQDLEMLQNAFDAIRSITEEKYNDNDDQSEDKDEPSDSSNCVSANTSNSSIENDQSPIKSLSNLVSSPMDVSASQSAETILANTVKNNLIDLLNNKLTGDMIPSTSAIDKPSSSLSHTSDSSYSDDGDNYTDQSSFLAESTIDEYPMENLFNSAVDKGLFENEDESVMDREISNLATTSHGQESTSGSLPSFQNLEPLKNKRFQYLLHKTSKFKHPIGQSKQKAFMQSVVNKHKKKMQIRQESNLDQPSTSKADPYITNTRKLILQPSPSTSAENPEDLATPSTSKQVFKAPDTPKKPQRVPVTSPTVDTKKLLEASKNLTQKLKKLSKEVLTNKIDFRNAEEAVRSKLGPGAVIESMKHHGKGIYSGTFSGTLNPALQDRYGRPKRDISTIIHILNDLLCATPPIALAHKESKHSCSSSSGDEEAAKCPGCSRAACAYGECEGHAGGAGVPPAGGCVCAAPPACPHRTCPHRDSDACKQCDTAKTLALDNSKTKCKLEQLRLVMQQKKQRREARKLKTLPYSTPPKTVPAPDQPQPMQEEIETLA